MKLSIIIPVLNEEKALPSCLKALKEGGPFLPEHEVIVADGGSTDKTCRIAKEFAQVIQAPRGRAAQMNEGAKVAKGEWLFFLHADSQVTPKSCRKLAQIIQENKLIGGCFSQKIDHPNPVYAYLAWTGNVRARITKVFYGDQAIFVRKDIFDKLGGYPAIPIMEEVVFTRKLREVGPVAVQREKTISSPRRWEKLGILKTTLLYFKVCRGFAKGIAPEKLKEIYLDIR